MTYRELVYMCLDEIKLASDDSYITEDHILFLISKYRAFLLRQKYDKTNAPIADSNFQLITLSSEEGKRAEEEALPSHIMNVVKPQIKVDCQVEMGSKSFYCTYVTPHRFEFVGENRILKPITYCTIDNQNKIKFKIIPEGLTNISCYAVFEDCVKVSEFEESDILDKTCPIEAELVSGVQELVVKDALGIAYRPQDKANNATDDLSSVGMVAGNPKNNK